LLPGAAHPAPTIPPKAIDVRAQLEASASPPVFPEFVPEVRREERPATSNPASVAPQRDTLIGPNGAEFGAPEPPKAGANSNSAAPASSSSATAAKVEPLQTARPKPVSAEPVSPSSRPSGASEPAPSGSAKPNASSAPEPIDAPVDLPPLADPERARGAEKSSFVLPGARGPFASAPVVVRASSDPLEDPQVKRAVADPTTIRSTMPPRAVFEAGKPAARVGDEVVTLHELKLAIAMRRKGMPADRPLSATERYMLAKSVLNDLVDRSIVLQEAKRELKDPKRLQMFTEIADQTWTEHELPPLLRQTASANIHELKQKLSERGESVDEIKEQFRKEFLTRGYLEQKLSPKMRVSLPEMQAYYIEHLRDFDRPAQVNWREVLVEVSKYRTRAHARAKVDTLLGRLRRGEDFATLARAESDGPNKSDGGRWQTSPDSYGVPAVNAALAALPQGQISQVIEGPSTFHIIRVEGRRVAGPATFAEVQDEVARKIHELKIRRESIAYLEKLRQRTLITTVFDDPAVVPASAELRIPATPASARLR
jgi:peptidyl-prolyl cis-trans isomerase SurA